MLCCMRSTAFRDSCAPLVSRQSDWMRRRLYPISSTDNTSFSWFRQTKFSSFQRQLNLYGFKRITAGRDKGGYYHELFLRTKPFLAHHILRTEKKGQGYRKPSSPNTEPNLYLQTFLPTTKGSNVAERKNASPLRENNPALGNRENRNQASCASFR